MGVLLFLGAGASAMFGKRTTAEFLQVLPEHLDEDTKPFYDLLVSEIKFKDIEDVLQDLKEARLFGKKEIGKLAFSYVLDPDVRHVQNDFLPLAKKLEGQIESAIKSHYKWKPDHNQKLEVYRQIFLYLRSGTRSVTVFTTNYDTPLRNIVVMEVYILALTALLMNMAVAHGLETLRKTSTTPYASTNCTDRWDGSETKSTAL